MPATPGPGSQSPDPDPGSPGAEAPDLAGRESDLAGWDTDLTERERQARQGPPDRAALRRLADERDALMCAREDAADRRDQEALARRTRALQRDVTAADRDRRRRHIVGGDDPDFAGRFLSGRDLDAAAGDRADALDDERHARADRQRATRDRQRAARDRHDATEAAEHAAAAADTAAERARTDQAHLRAALEDRTIIGQAQGLLMARLGVSADRAFEMLVEQAQVSDVELRHAAQGIVDEHRPHPWGRPAPPPPDR